MVSASLIFQSNQPSPTSPTNTPAVSGTDQRTQLAPLPQRPTTTHVSEAKVRTPASLSPFTPVTFTVPSLFPFPQLDQQLFVDVSSWFIFPQSSNSSPHQHYTHFVLPLFSPLFSLFSRFHATTAPCMDSCTRFVVASLLHCLHLHPKALYSHAFPSSPFFFFLSPLLPLSASSLPLLTNLSPPLSPPFRQALIRWIKTLDRGEEILTRIFKQLNIQGRPDDFFRHYTDAQTFTFLELVAKVCSANWLCFSLPTRARSNSHSHKPHPLPNPKFPHSSPFQNQRKRDTRSTSASSRLVPCQHSHLSTTGTSKSCTPSVATSTQC